MFSYTPAATSSPAHPVLANGEKTNKHKHEEKEKGKVSLEQLFNYGRVKPNAPFINKLLFLLYLPLGVLVIATRIVLFLVLVIAILALPRKVGDPFTMPLMRLVCGLVVRHNNKNREKPLLNEPHIVAANHVADFDTFAMWVVLPKFHTLTGAHLKAIPLIGNVYSKLNAIFVTQTPELIIFRAPILIFPEGGLTNGGVGTMMYHRFVFSLDCSVVPAAIALRDPWPVTHDYLGSSFPRNLLWFLFVPFHIFEITLLPAQRRNEGEAAEDFAGRVQKLTSDYLNIEATQWAYSDKKELWKDISSGKKKIL